MPHPILAFTGDNHLRPSTWAKHPDLRGDEYASFRQVTAYCADRGLPLMQLGDLFDKTRPDSESVTCYLEAVAALASRGVDFYYIDGNHDNAKPSWASLYKQAKPPGEYTLGGITFYSLSFQDSESLASQLAALPSRVQVVMTHQSWAEIQKVGHVDGRFSMFPRGVVLLTGDYHVCGMYQGQAANGEPVIAYSPGSTSMQAVNEQPDKYFGILYDDLHVEWQRLNTRSFFAVDCVNEESLDNLISRLDSFFDTNGLSRGWKPILRVRYFDSIPDAYDRLTAAAGERCHLFLEPQREATQTTVDTQFALFDDLRSVVTACCGSNVPVNNGLQRLLTAPSPQQELSLMYAEFMENDTISTGVPPNPMGQGHPANSGLPG